MQQFGVILAYCLSNNRSIIVSGDQSTFLQSENTKEKKTQLEYKKVYGNEMSGNEYSLNKQKLVATSKVRIKLIAK